MSVAKDNKQAIKDQRKVSEQDVWDYPSPCLVAKECPYMQECTAVDMGEQLQNRQQAKQATNNQ